MPSKTYYLVIHAQLHNIMGGIGSPCTPLLVSFLIEIVGVKRGPVVNIITTPDMYTRTCAWNSLHIPTGQLNNNSTENKIKILSQYHVPVIPRPIIWHTHLSLITFHITSQQWNLILAYNIWFCFSTALIPLLDTFFL